jgi:hypothetical protein
MVQFAPINFGLIIAYILPGTVTVYGLRYLSPRIDALWSTLERGQIVVGPLILIGVSALAVGLIVSSFRVVVLEPILYCTGVKQTIIKYDKIADAERRELFSQMVENVYRYEQFYGNVLLSLLLFSILRYFVGYEPIAQTRSDIAAFVAILGSLVVLSVATRKQLAEVSRAVDELCK